MLIYVDIFIFEIKSVYQLTGTVSWDFLLQVSLWSSPKTLKIILESFRNFSKIRWDIRKSRCTTGTKKLLANFPPVSTTVHRWQIEMCHRYQRHRRQILPPVQLMLLIPVTNLPPVSANLSPVSTTPVANNEKTISDCWNLKVNLKKKIYLYVNSTAQRCPKIILKTFQTEDFFHLSPVSTTPDAPWAGNFKIFHGAMGARQGLKSAESR